MKKLTKILSVTLVLLLLVLIITSISNDEDIDVEGKTPIEGLRQNASVKVSHATFENKDSGKVIVATIVNESEIPVTLVNMRLTCEDTIHEFLTGQEKTSSGRFVPVEIGVGEEYLFEQSVPEKFIQVKDCSLEVLNWSKYGVKE